MVRMYSARHRPFYTVFSTTEAARVVYHNPRKGNSTTSCRKKWDIRIQPCFNPAI